MSDKEKVENQVKSRPQRVSLLDKLPPWISNNLRSKRQWKMLVRCWVATWAAFILLLPNNSLQVLGNAYVLLDFWRRGVPSNPHVNSAFFAPLASLMVVPNMPVQLFFFVSFLFKAELLSIDLKI